MHPLPQLTVRRANAGDIATMSAVMTASITELCAADHDNDPAAIADWTVNKTPAGVRAMLERPALKMLVAERNGVVAAVGGIEGDVIMLNYVAPEHRFAGVSKMLLAAMEAELKARGTVIGRLVSTATARRFYLAAGWHEITAGAPGTGYPMSKTL